MSGGAWDEAVPYRRVCAADGEHDPAWPAPYLPCPECGRGGFHLLVRVETPGVTAHWPDPAAAHWRRECRSCGHVWRQPA